MTIKDKALSAIADGARWNINLSERILVVNGEKLIDHGKYEGELGIESLSSNILFNDVFKNIDLLYSYYKHSIPSERCDNKRHLYFKALPESKLNQNDMLYGPSREVAQFALESYILSAVLLGLFRWDEERMGKWFYQSRRDKDLVILRSWIEGSEQKA